MPTQTLPQFWLAASRGNRQRVLHASPTCARGAVEMIEGVMNVRNVVGGHRMRICKKCLGAGQGAEHDPLEPNVVIPRAASLRADVVQWWKFAAVAAFVVVALSGLIFSSYPALLLSGGIVVAALLYRELA
jgi:hypothetical protein